jgi:hypothetical protein
MFPLPALGQERVVPYHHLLYKDIVNPEKRIFGLVLEIQLEIFVPACFEDGFSGCLGQDSDFSREPPFYICEHILLVAFHPFAEDIFFFVAYHFPLLGLVDQMTLEHRPDLKPKKVQKIPNVFSVLNLGFEPKLGPVLFFRRKNIYHIPSPIITISLIFSELFPFDHPSEDYLASSLVDFFCIVHPNLPNLNIQLFYHPQNPFCPVFHRFQIFPNLTKKVHYLFLPFSDRFLPIG